MVISELASALLLASAPVQAAGVRPLQFSPLSVATATTQFGATIERSDIGFDAFLAPSVSDEPIRSVNPAVSDVPDKTTADITTTGQVAVSPDPSAQIETEERPQYGNEIIVTARTRSPIDPLQTINAEILRNYAGR